MLQSCGIMHALNQWPPDFLWLWDTLKIQGKWQTTLVLCADQKLPSTLAGDMILEVVIPQKIVECPIIYHEFQNQQE